MRYGRKLRTLLWERGIAPSRFAVAIGVTPGYLSKILLHPQPNPSSAVFCRIVLDFARFGPEDALTPDEILELVEARHADEVAEPANASNSALTRQAPLSPLRGAA